MCSYIACVCFRITEALIAANDYLMIPGKDNKYKFLFITILWWYIACFSHRGLKMSEAIWDPHAYAKLTDQVVQLIQFSTDPQLQKVCVYSM